MATASLIKEDPHIADTVNKTESYRVLRGRVNGLGYSPDARLIPYLELAGFRSAALIRTFDLRYDLISVLVERWGLETHTFHLLCGECTVILEDVILQLGLPIDGSPVTGVSAIAEPAALCYSLLGASPGDDESNLSGLKFTWLKANFQHLPDNATEEELMCAARAYIMHIIGGVLMPDANNNRVHIMYLPLLTDLHNVRSYSWGSAVLAMLYCELCRTTKPHAADIGGCLILLQSWALYWMPFLASVSHQPYVYPLVNRWSIYPGIGRSYTVPIYRLLIEQHAGEGFIWMPYRRLEIMAVIPSSAYFHSQLWCTNAAIINFNVVEWYHGDRVLRQFGCIQYIPDPPKEVGKVHGINKRGKHGMHWGVVHRRYITVWDNRMGRRPRMDMSSDLQPSPEYMQWYFSMGKPYLLGAQSTVVPPHVQRPGAYEPVADIEPHPQPNLESEREVEPEAQPVAESEQSHSHSADTSYHPDFPDNDYFLGSSGGGYHYGFDIFGSSPS
ncbi:serine/threonine-protein phosphatase 7 long form homolog [Gossypium hirsutum]|uniref:Serine/threonine-protein phosphatase 7 long form homolog n=1 Tax=Gossypium hirsutum TaxID=3635 RepID=A0A1U8NYM2_GOSHI|nr:serine/threonine-protein phosphatase 7 long form homolog [Gossypium hirsutum]